MEGVFISLSAGGMQLGWWCPRQRSRRSARWPGLAGSAVSARGPRRIKLQGAAGLSQCSTRLRTRAADDDGELGEVLYGPCAAGNTPNEHSCAHARARCVDWAARPGVAAAARRLRDGRRCSGPSLPTSSTSPSSSTNSAVCLSG